MDRRGRHADQRGQVDRAEALRIRSDTIRLVVADGVFVGIWCRRLDRSSIGYLTPIQFETQTPVA